MRAKNIFNYAFVIGLVLLILNDHFLKDLFGNWFTGKLSDFAGILILPMFLKFCFLMNTRKSVIITIAVFLFWKSSFSQILIDFINSFELIKINRVIDYSDFLAFLILPISIYVLENAKKFEIKIEHTKLKKVGVNILFIISAFTFFATSVDDNVPNIQTTAINIESCCDFEPINTDLGTGKIYIPTVFTPDENGVNDYFQPSVDSNILRIDTFIVMSSVTGDIVFEQFNLEEITPEFGFDGNVAGITIATQYSYIITATSKDSITERFTGVVCCLPCTFPINASSPDSIGNCAFPVQFNSNEGYDENIDPGEVLDCFN